MQDSGQYSINAEEASRLQLKLSIKQFTYELCRFGYCEKISKQATLNKNVCENYLNLRILLTVGKIHDRRPWPETRIFIEKDSACRNQQLFEGNCDPVENGARPFLLFFQHCD